MNISVFNWFYLIRGLRKRGKGKRESGAFLVAKNGTRKISRIIFYDEIDPSAFDTGIIVLDGLAHGKLNNELIKYNGEVIADIHTHPIGCSTMQSNSDKQHPMLRIRGHIALIAPNYAMNIFLLPKQCSAYLYQGAFLWKTLINDEFPIKLTLL